MDWNLDWAEGPGKNLTVKLRRIIACNPTLMMIWAFNMQLMQISIVKMINCLDISIAHFLDRVIRIFNRLLDRAKSGFGEISGSRSFLDRAHFGSRKNTSQNRPIQEDKITCMSTWAHSQASINFLLTRLLSKTRTLFLTLPNEKNLLRDFLRSVITVYQFIYLIFYQFLTSGNK